VSDSLTPAPPTPHPPPPTSFFQYVHRPEFASGAKVAELYGKLGIVIWAKLAQKYSCEAVAAALLEAGLGVPAPAADAAADFAELRPALEAAAAAAAARAAPPPPPPPPPPPASTPGLFDAPAAVAAAPRSGLFALFGDDAGAAPPPAPLDEEEEESPFS
jgi:hypothetical protein